MLMRKISAEQSYTFKLYGAACCSRPRRGAEVSLPASGFLPFFRGGAV